MHRGSRGLVAERGCRVRRAWGIFGSRGGGRAVCSVSVRFGAGARRPGRESRALRGAWSRTRRVQVHAGAGTVRPTAHADRSANKGHPGVT
jgi:hypothetical protein